MLQNNMAIKVAINGALGKMGKTIANLAYSDKDFAVACPLESKNHPHIGMDYGTILNGKKAGVKLSRSLKKSDVLIDFSTPSATLDRLPECKKLRIPTVIGTTGFSSKEHEAIRQFAKNIPIIMSSNMSFGINIAVELLSIASKKLGVQFKPEIIEIHHDEKKDAPSGTALLFASAIASSRNIPIDNITIHSLRLGDYVGEHHVIFASKGESIEIIHKARSRDIFARGALIAGKFAVKARPGLYSMADVIKSF